MSIQASRCLGRSRSVEQLVETWQIEHKEAMFACDIQALVTECLWLGDLIRVGWTEAVGRLFSEAMDDQADDIGRVGEMMKMAISKAVFAAGTIEEAVGTVERSGHSIEKSSDLRNLVQELRGMHQEAKKLWPEVNQELVEESLAAYIKGEYQLSEELLTDAKSCGAQAH